MVIRHLYQRTITSSGKKIKAWYYWYYDSNGKQVRKSCGQKGKPCIRKRDAEAFLASLGETSEEKITFESFCKGMFDEDSNYMKKYIAMGNKDAPATIRVKQRYLELILNKFGKRNPKDLSEAEIDDWLLSMNYANSTRNEILYVFQIVYSSLYEYRKVNFLPKFQRFHNEKTEKGILSFEEIERLFPHDYDEIIKIWRWKTKTYEPDWQVFVYAAMIFTCLTTGMRKGELRALKYSQFIQPNVILINSRLDNNSKEIAILKKGTVENRRWRISIVPERTVEMIHYLTEHRMDRANKYVFTYHEHPFGSTHMTNVFYEILNRNGIDTEARNISLHSLRYTYNTIMKSRIDNVDLRLMMGHVSEKMTDYYDRSTVIDHIPELLENKQTIDSIFH